MSSLRQVGHCNVPAAFAHATPAQNRLVSIVEDMVMVVSEGDWRVEGRRGGDLEAENPSRARPS